MSTEEGHQVWGDMHAIYLPPQPLREGPCDTGDPVHIRWDIHGRGCSMQGEVSQQRRQERRWDDVTSWVHRMAIESLMQQSFHCELLHYRARRRGQLPKPRLPSIVNLR